MKNKGFTLIELLAVIVILAIIALITLPIINNVIENAKKGAIEDSTYGIIETANLYYAQNVEDNIDTNAQIRKSDKKLSYKGQVDDFIVSYNKDGDVSVIVYNDKYCGYKSYSETKVKTGEIEDSFCKIDGSVIDPDTLLPTTQDLMIWVHNVNEVPSSSGQLNEIQIISDLDISNYVVSSLEPTVKEKGTVWIKNDTNSNFGITMNNIYVPIYGIMQYDGNKWNQVEGYLYNGTEWKKVSEITYKEIMLNGADPIIKGSLIPVTIENDGTVKKASLSSEWYKYEKQRWANAVILKDETVTYEDNAVIPENNIESYFVWIPRYRYKLWNTGEALKTAHSIEIEFENKEVAVSNGNTNGSWLTHPAFTTFDVNGMWVGKFETGYDGATSATSAQVDSNDSSKVIVKPNVYSWRNITVSNIFISLYNYNRTLDSHMMKNTEWGAVAYLSHSKYGINKEVNINNNSNYLTGYSAADGTDQSDYPGTYGTAASVTQPYNTETGYKASTTGNITGVYDMSGGAHEYVAGYMSGIVGSSGFTTSNITSYGSKYFDVYNASSTQTSYNYRILGDATGEMGPINYYADGDEEQRYHNSWYADYSHFVQSSTPWFYRGGYCGNGVLAGQFLFAHNTGGTSTGLGSRLVLSFN